MCDHFTGNPNNPGWTSTGVGGIYLKKIQEHFHGAIGPGTLDRIYRIIRISPVPKENQVAFDEATKTKAIQEMLTLDPAHSAKPVQLGLNEGAESLGD